MPAASTVRITDLGHNIFCIDTGMVRPGLAAAYIVRQGQQAAIIETGTHVCVPTILAALAELDLSTEQVKYIIPTHVHLDHAGGAGGLMAACANAQLLIHPRGARHMIDPAKLKAGTIAVYGEEIFASVYGDLIAIDEQRVTIAEDSSVFYLADRELICYDSPGHARHHMCIHDPLSEGIFSGDTFGVSYPELSASCEQRFIFPPTTPVHFDPVVWPQTIDRLMTLNPKRMYLTHFGMVEDLEPLAQDLKQQIAAYAEIALSCKDADNPMQALTDALNNDTLARLEKVGSPMTPEQQLAVIGMDNGINAQGLAVWLQQQ